MVVQDSVDPVQVVKSANVVKEPVNTPHDTQNNGEDTVFGPWMLDKGKEKKVVNKDPSAQIDNLHKEPSPMEIMEKQKKDDWEREVMAMMSRYHNKRWEAHSKGEYVGDLWSMDKSDFLEFLQGNSSSSSKGHTGKYDLDKPPDNNSMSENKPTQNGRENNPAGSVAQPKGYNSK
ncbi:hypothetical protein SESBI_39496 [Sesbania bispinosa]|nr:hypothetical protein SESBI_39496 [Sesbania bispinosa]